MWAVAPLGNLPGDCGSVYLFQDHVQHAVLDIHRGRDRPDRMRCVGVAVGGWNQKAMDRKLEGMALSFSNYRLSGYRRADVCVHLRDAFGRG